AYETDGVAGVLLRQGIVVDAHLPSTFLKRPPEKLEPHGKARLLLTMMRQIIEGPHDAFQVTVVFHEFVLLELLVEKENESPPRQIFLCGIRQGLPPAHERLCWLSHFPDLCK